MKSELIVDVQSDQISIAFTEDDRLMEVCTERRDEATFAVGNIYYGRVKKVMPALNAVFVDVGHEKEAFLHYLDLGAQFLTLEKFTQTAVQDKKRVPLMQKTPNQKEVGKQGSIADYCHVGQEILVQVSKEPINTKGPRLTAEISLAGRNLVLIPFGDKVMVSNKIKSEAERSRLRQLLQSIRPQRFGIIVRTVAEGKRVAELDAELRLLVKRWEDTVARLQKAKPVSLVEEELGRTIGVIRDAFTPDFAAIHVNDEAIYEEVKNYVSLIAPEAEKIVKLYTDKQPIFDHFQITRQMKSGLGRTVGFKNGGYLIMERTEALFSIDVNSGSRKLGTDQEDNAFNCNMLAADEIYHQLRLRDIGGIIIVDFIDMDSAEHRQQLFEHMRSLMKHDRARHNVLQLSKFGLMQITRQRVRPVVDVEVQEDCPCCHGTGRIQPSILFTDQLDEQIELYCSHFGKGLRLYVHPFVYAYATKGFFLTTLKMRWRRKYGVQLLEDQSLPMLGSRFTDADGKQVIVPAIQIDSVEKKADRKAALYATKPIEEKAEKPTKAEKKAQKKQEANESKENKKAEKANPKPAKQNNPKQDAPKQDSPKQPELVKTSAENVASDEKLLNSNVASPTEKISPEAKPSKSRRRRSKKSNPTPELVAAEEQNPLVTAGQVQLSASNEETIIVVETELPKPELPAQEETGAAKPKSKRRKTAKKAVATEQTATPTEPIAPSQEEQSGSPVQESQASEEKPKKAKARRAAKPKAKKAEAKESEATSTAEAAPISESAANVSTESADAPVKKPRKRSSRSKKQTSAPAEGEQTNSDPNKQEG